MADALSLDHGFWPILALDHGLTVGHKDSVSVTKLPSVLEACRENIGAVVMTYGLARISRTYNKLPLIIQCFGAPLGHPKVQVCSINQAIDVGATGVAVQIDFSLPEVSLNQQLRSVSSFVGKAHNANLPTLFMVAPHDTSVDRDSLVRLFQSIRFCIELGADLIKAKCNVLSLYSDSFSELSDLVKDSPPVLLAGGEANNNIVPAVSAARKLGFSGYCIGRNIFQNSDPSTMSRMLCESWQNLT